MATDNLSLLRDGYEAFSKGDMARLAELFADDVVWHTPGHNVLSGDYRGKDAVFAMFARLTEETGGTFRVELHDLLADDEHGVGLITITGRRGNRSITVNDVNVFHLRDGKVTECWLASTDQAAEDQFWA